MRLTSAQVRYLMAVLTLSGDGKGVRPSEIAYLLEVARPSVTRMLSMLAASGLLFKNSEGRVYLTEDGRALSQKYRRTVESLSGRLETALGVTSETARECALLLMSQMPEAVADLPAGHT